MKAAQALLFDEGLGQLTVERVAARSGASRMTIHKWWPSKGSLAFDAYREAVAPDLSFDDTGDVVADLRMQLHAFVHLMTRTPAGRVLRELIGLSQLDADLRAGLVERYSTPRRQLAIEALRRAQERGQVRGDVDPSTVVDQLWGACYHRLLLSDLPVTTDFADELLANVTRGIMRRALSLGEG
ncbi:MAG TPA: TetR/AcrR family transcriptional regulator C-terminal ligand-binding domain-containing protein [Candidatus Limnocylindria bacterium]|jgi:AcrR family transcriptional regulator|nr:TetR/AcrR family transcriptional regulator C-terminal ligand-binding domain-containing protein [Candidatus Limnocylindria bacterium]